MSSLQRSVSVIPAVVTADERRRSLEERLVAARRDLATAEHAGKRGVLVRALRNEIAKLEEQRASLV